MAESQALLLSAMHKDEADAYMIVSVMKRMVYLQVGVNSPFKSGADYWRESSEPSRLSMDGTDNAQLPTLAPVGRLFDFRAGRGPEAAGAESAQSSLPSMPEWLYTRPHLTGEDLLKVSSNQPKMG